MTANLENNNLVEGIVNNLKIEVNEKVDKKQLPEKVKILFEQFDQEEENVSKP